MAPGAARANAAHGQATAAIALLAPLQDKHPGYCADEVGLTPGRAYAANDQQSKVGAQFDAMVERFASIEARAGLALWAIANGKDALAQQKLNEIAHARKHMEQHTPERHQALFRRLDGASGL